MQTDTYWYKKNELGDIAEIYGVNGKICEYRYDAWGNYRLIDSGTGMDVTKDQVIGGISTNVSAHIGQSIRSVIVVIIMMKRRASTI